MDRDLTQLERQALANLRGHYGFDVLRGILERDRQLLIESIKTAKTAEEALKAIGRLDGFDYTLRRINKILEDSDYGERRLEEEA